MISGRGAGLPAAGGSAASARVLLGGVVLVPGGGPDPPLPARGLLGGRGLLLGCRGDAVHPGRIVEALPAHVLQRHGAGGGAGLFPGGLVAGLDLGALGQLLGGLARALGLLGAQLGHGGPVLVDGGDQPARAEGEQPPAGCAQALHQRPHLEARGHDEGDGGDGREGDGAPPGREEPRGQARQPGARHAARREGKRDELGQGQVRQGGRGDDEDRVGRGADEGDAGGGAAEHAPSQRAEPEREHRRGEPECAKQEGRRAVADGTDQVQRREPARDEPAIDRRVGGEGERPGQRERQDHDRRDLAGHPAPDRSRVGPTLPGTVLAGQATVRLGLGHVDAGPPRKWNTPSARGRARPDENIGGYRAVNFPAGSDAGLSPRYRAEFPRLPAGISGAIQPLTQKVP